MISEQSKGPIEIFFGSVHRNVSALSHQFDRKTYHQERSLGSTYPRTAPSIVQSELLPGCVWNEATINITEANKITVDLGMLAIDHQLRDGNNPGAGGADER